MNGAIINLFARPYQQVVDDILTAMVGGVVNEPIVFDVNRTRYPLSQRASDLRSVSGTVTVAAGSGPPQVTEHTFDIGVDVLFSPADNSVAWVKGGTFPDDQSTFYVDYFRPDSAAISPLTDLNVGSVTRTLSEAVGREIATVYQEINQAYLAGFVDTAAGTSLDLVVSILGVVRRTKDYAIGLVSFFRDPSSQAGSVTIPQGTAVRTASGVVFETSDIATLQLGQVRIDVAVRAGTAWKGPAGLVKAGEINTLEIPIAGISRVTNFDATVLGSSDETDAQLRERAKTTLQYLGKGTIAALTRAVFDESATLNQIRDPNTADAPTPPGTVALLVQAEPARIAGVEAAVNETRAAGVLASIVGRYVFFQPRLILQVAAGMTEAAKARLLDQVVAAIEAYVDGLKPGQAADGSKVAQAIVSAKAVKATKDIRFVDVLASRADVAPPGTQTLEDALVAAVSSVPAGDEAALRSAIEGVLSPSFSEARIPDAGLVLGPDGKTQATYAEIEAGQFQVSSIVNGEKWAVVLDMQTSDIMLVEQ